MEISDMTPLTPLARELFRAYKDGRRTLANVGLFLNANKISQLEYDTIVGSES